ncbi:MAG: hypothetical protein WCT11_02400 [Candidatus Magasanikbacteria bacterium]
MFRHKNTTDPKEENKTISTSTEEKKLTPKTDTETIKELLEKNLKWSQIIYEQNRKINNKLMWSAIANWFRILIIVIPLVLAIWFLPPLIKDLQNTYGGLLGGKTTTDTNNTNNSNSIDQLLKILPLDPAKQEQLKVLLK